MSFKKISPSSITLLLIMVAVAVLRLVTNFAAHYSPITNFTPVGAMALFGGAFFQGRVKPLIFPLLTLLISDVVLSFTIYSSFRSGLLYEGWYWTYAAFVLMVIAGKVLIKTVNALNFFLSIAAATLIHWLVSDIGACLNGNTTADFLSRYGQRLLTAIPYELNFLGGTLVYALLMFGSFSWLQRKYPKLAANQRSVR